MPKRSGTPADQLARNYGVHLNDFATAVIGVIADCHPERATDVAARREVCAAVSAAMALALDATTLTDDERTRLAPLVHEVLAPFWRKHCADDGGAADYIAQRIAHYTDRRAAGSHVKSAVNLVGALLDAMNVPVAARVALSERLVPAFGHRLVADTYLINDVRARNGIELSLLATLCGMLQMSLSCEAILRALRLG